MKVCVTLDDGLKSHLTYWNKVGLPSTFFVLPELTELATHYRNRADNILTWGEVRLLTKSGLNEIGFHGYSSRYEKWGPERTAEAIHLHKEMFKNEIGYYPVSFAYTNMQAYQLPVICKEFLYIRDFFWRDSKQDEYVLRIPKTPDDVKPFIDKVFCIHHAKSLEGTFRQIRRAQDMGYKYCVMVLHDITDYEIELTRLIRTIYDTCTFREIFEGQSKGDNGGSPTPATVNNEAALTGSTPVASPAK